MRCGVAVFQHCHGSRGSVLAARLPGLASLKVGCLLLCFLCCWLVDSGTHLLPVALAGSINGRLETNKLAP